MVSLLDETGPTKVIRSRRYLNPWLYSYLPHTLKPGYTPKPSPVSNMTQQTYSKYSKLLQILKLLSVNPLNPSELLYSMSDSSSVIFVVMSQYAIYKFENKECMRLTQLCKANRVIMATDFKVEWINRRRFMAMFGKILGMGYHRKKTETMKKCENDEAEDEDLELYALLKIDRFHIFNFEEIEFQGIVPLVYEMTWYSDMLEISKFDYNQVLLEDGEELAC